MMNAAEFKTLRESLGLTVQWIAAQTGVAERTARYWEAGERHKIPADAVTLLLDADQRFDRAVQHVLARITALPQAPAAVSLVRYRTDEDLRAFRPDMAPLTATAHAALLDRTRRALEAREITVSIVYMAPDAYRAWLGARADNEPMRALWAADPP